MFARLPGLSVSYAQHKNSSSHPYKYISIHRSDGGPCFLVLQGNTDIRKTMRFTIILTLILAPLMAVCNPLPAPMDPWFADVESDGIPSSCAQIIRHRFCLTDNQNDHFAAMSGAL
jgi:hypothetical protein